MLICKGLLKNGRLEIEIFDIRRLVLLRTPSSSHAQIFAMLRKCAILKGKKGLGLLLVRRILLVNLAGWRFCRLRLCGGEGSENLGRVFVNIFLMGSRISWKKPVTTNNLFLILQIILLVRVLLIILAPIFAAICSRRNCPIIQILISRFAWVTRSFCRFWL